MIVAKFREGFDAFYKNVDPNKVAEEIISIGDEPNPDDIVDKARNKNCELHKCFTWDNDEAADKWRKQEARQLMYRLVIKEEEPPKDRPEIRMFYKTNDSGGYKPTEIVVTHKDEYTQLLERAYAELRAFKAKYSCLKELQEIFDLIK